MEDVEQEAVRKALERAVKDRKNNKLLKAAIKEERARMEQLQVDS